MLSFANIYPDDVARRLALRFRDRRLEYGWSREELGARSGVAVPTLRHFEDTGKISLDRLLKLAHTLGILDEFARIAEATTTPRTLAELEALEGTRRRRRGRSSRTDRP